jgi:hypothetical protein
MARGPGPVAAVHRLLVVSALLCALVYGAWELRQYGRTGDRAAPLRAAAAFVVAAGIAVYLRRLRGLRAKLTPPDPPVRRNA